MTITPKQLLNLQTADEAIDDIIVFINHRLGDTQGAQVLYGEEASFPVKLSVEMSRAMGFDLISKAISEHFLSAGWTSVVVGWQELSEDKFATVYLKYQNA
jgi:hypothetical protein